MEKEIEFLECMYEDSDMAIHTLHQLLKDLEGKDNKIKKGVEQILEGYRRYQEKWEQLLEERDQKPKTKGMVSKMMSSMGIKKEVVADNSDSSLADMLIKGISMGTIDIEKKISEYDEFVDKKMVSLAKDFLAFQQDNITALKEYL